MRFANILNVFCGGLMVAGAAQALPTQVTPTSYDAPNGFTGSFNYWDDSYDGSGSTTTDGAALTGGLGDLTDGVIATDNWFVVEAPDGPGPYVGWTVDPILTFRFAKAYDFTAMTFYLDDSNGLNQYGTAGGVNPPSSITVNGVNYVVPDPASGAPFAFTVDLTGLSTDTITSTLFRSDIWVFLSEVTFTADVPTVPLPAGVVLLGSAVAGLGMLRRRRHG